MKQQIKAHLPITDMQKKMRKELNLRHTVDFQYNDSIERYLLSYEVELRGLSTKDLEKELCDLSPFDFLSGVDDEDIIKKSNLRLACENFWSDPDENNPLDSFENAKKTITKHIKAITGKSYKDWLSSSTNVDALKTFYLLYQLRIVHSRGLNMLVNYSDKRYSEVEIFSHRLTPINKNDEYVDCDVIVLSNWLREYFVRVTWNLPLSERGILKNLDIFASGFLALIRMLMDRLGNSAEKYLDEFLPDVSKSKGVEQEPLSIKLMKHWQLTSYQRNSAACNDEAVTLALRKSFDLQYVYP
jgi:hypothetical protein